MSALVFLIVLPIIAFGLITSGKGGQAIFGLIIGVGAALLWAMALGG